MALTNQQVQQVFLAITGRPAEGSAVAWGANSLSVAALANAVVDIRKGADFTNSKEAFVENLYSQLLGRPSDAEGKEFWLEALNNGVSYGDVLSQFITAVLAQPATADLYTLQNKLSIAEQISAQINTFQGGAAAEATLKALMSTVNANTTIDSIQDSVVAFKGQNVDITTATVQQGAEEPAKGSDEHTTTFNATYDLGKDGEITIEGSSSFADTLNLSVKGVKDEAESLTSIGTVSGIKTLNITTDTNIKTSDLDSSKVGGATSVTFKGSSVDTFAANSAMTLLDTGAGDDIITLNAKVATVKAGAGDDNITVSAEGVAMSIDGGTGSDTIILTAASSGTADLNEVDYSKLTLSNINVISGGTVGGSGSGDGVAMLASSQLNNKTYTIADTSVIGTKAASGADFSKLTVAETGSAKLYINGVKSGTIKLNAEDGIAETTTLVATAKGVTVSGNASGDKVIFDWNATLSIEATPASNGLAANKIYQVNQVLNGLSDIQGLVAANKTFSANSFIVGGDVDNGYKIYQVTSDIARGATDITTAGAVKLIGTIQGDGSAAATLSIDGSDNALLTFA